MSSAKLSERRGGILALAVAVLSGAAIPAFADPLVGKTTSKVIATVAHIIVERIGGSTLDRVVAPYIDETLVQYLSGDPAKIQPALEQQRVEISQHLNDSAEKDIPILKAQLALVQKELNALKALQNAAPGSASLTEASTTVRQTAAQMAVGLEDRGVQLAKVQQKLEDVTVRFQRADTADSKTGPSPAAATLRPPSFDCHKARTEMEHLICDNPKLGDIDGRLGEVYWELRHFLAPSESQQLRKEEIAWIRRRDQSLDDACKHGDAVDMPCVIGLWKERIDQLEAQLQNAKGRRL